MGNISDRMVISIENNNTIIYLDGEILFQKDGGMHWKYVINYNGLKLYQMIKNFDDRCLNVFLADIWEQLSNGVDRNNLTINKPEIKTTVEIKVSCGNQTMYL